MPFTVEVIKSRFDPVAELKAFMRAMMPEAIFHEDTRNLTGWYHRRALIADGELESDDWTPVPPIPRYTTRGTNQWVVPTYGHGVNSRHLPDRQCGACGCMNPGDTDRCRVCHTRWSLVTT